MNDNIIKVSTQMNLIIKLFNDGLGTVSSNNNNDINNNPNTNDALIENNIIDDYDINDFNF